MPFLTEELYQRLPRRPSDKTESICISEYPEDIPSLDDAKSEETFNFVIDVIKAARSLKASYLKPKDVATFYFMCKNKDLANIIESEQSVINFIVKSELSTILDGKIPEGCVVATVNENCDVYLLVKVFIKLKKNENK
jgi:valyl-tRNA synthetase